LRTGYAAPDRVVETDPGAGLTTDFDATAIGARVKARADIVAEYRRE